MVDHIAKLTSEELTDGQLSAVAGGSIGNIEMNSGEKPIGATMQFGDQKIVVWATSECHGIIWTHS